MRVALVVCIALASSPGLQAAENRALLAAKTQYVKQTEPARADYIKALDAEIARLVSAGDLPGVLKLRTHRGEFLLGLKTADEFVKDGQVPQNAELTAAASKYVAALSDSRMALEAAYDPAVKAALGSNDVDAATRMRNELESLAKGEYAPSVMEVDRQNPFDVRQLALTVPIRAPVNDGTLPDELAVDFQAQRFRIAGTCRTDVAEVDGQRIGSFGKVVLVAPARGRIKERSGCLLIGTRDRQILYSVVVADGEQIAQVIQMDDLELNVPHEWSVVFDRAEVRFEVRRNGSVLKSARVPGNNRTIFGFSTTVRWPDTSSLLVVAVD